MALFCADALRLLDLVPITDFTYVGAKCGDDDDDDDDAINERLKVFGKAKSITLPKDKIKKNIRSKETVDQDNNNTCPVSVSRLSGSSLRNRQ